MALRYSSQRFTGDIDFSAPFPLSEFNPDHFKEALDEGLLIAVEALEYGLDCRVQKVEQQPARADASFPTIKTTVGYAYKHEAGAHKRLMRRQSSKIIKLDYSLNEPVGTVEFFELDEGNSIRVYDTVELIAEKLRALLQQEIRNRARFQDLYDLYYILDVCTLEGDEEIKAMILPRLIEKSEARGLLVSSESMANPEIKRRTQQGWEAELPSLIEDELLEFDFVYGEVERFYRTLPWE